MSNSASLVRAESHDAGYLPDIGTRFIPHYNVYVTLPQPICTSNRIGSINLNFILPVMYLMTL